MQPALLNVAASTYTLQCTSNLLPEAAYFALQNKEVPEDLKPGEVLLNPEGYFKAFKHVLSEHQKKLVLQQIKDHQDGVERLQASKVIRQNVEKQA